MADAVNGVFELLGGLAIWLNVRRTLRDKRVASIDWRMVAFFTIWGFWNLFYYAAIRQWWSWMAGINVAIANTVWFCLLVHYTRNPGCPPD